MKQHICAVHDKASELFMRPFAVPAVGVALREFADAVNNPESDFSKHPDHYTLFTLGEFDDNSGELTSAVASLGNGITFVKSGPSLVKEA